jgi:signal transduction histidine kinase
MNLAVLLDEQRNVIAQRWAELIQREMPHTRYGQCSIEQIAYFNQVAIELILSLIHNPRDIPAWIFDEPRQRYLALSVPVSELIESGLLLQETLCKEMLQGAGDTLYRDILPELQYYIRKFVALVVDYYAGQLNHQLEEQRARLAFVLDIIRRASRTLSVEQQIDLVIQSLKASLGTEHGMLYVLNEERTAGLLWGDIDAFPPAQDPNVRESLRYPLPLSNTVFTRKVAAAGRPIIYQESTPGPDDEIIQTCRRWNVRTMLGIPLAVEDRMVAVGLLFSTASTPSISEEKVNLAVDVAKALAPALGNALLHERVKQLAIIEERTRLAQELHDDLAQLLGAMQLKASLAEQMLAEGALDQTQSLLVDLQETLSRAYVDMREIIFNLRVAGAGGKAPLLPALQEYLVDLKRFYGIDVALEVKGSVSVQLSEHERLQVIRIIQEALTNARKHANATQIGLRLSQDAHALKICVKDNGLGFDPERMETIGKERFGLQVMRERAASIGATIALFSQPGQGTRLTLELPLAAGRGGVQ